MNAQKRIQWLIQELASSEELSWPTADQGPMENEGMWEEFGEHGGWALEWDGFALSEIRKRRSGREPSSTVDEG